MMNDQSVSIIRINKLDQLGHVFNRGLIQLYQAIFSDAPYYEYFEEEEVRDIFRSYVNEGSLFIANINQEVVGFGAAIPFLKSSIACLGKEITSDPEHTMYMAELGVRKDCRGRGLARQLVMARLNSFSPGTMVVMRTSEQNQASQSLYKSLGFNFLPFTSEVLQKRQDGTVRSDKRVFMAKLLV